jgi:glycosyltransferase involved in cell wall biosynthesis
MIEAMACATPVLAFRGGSVPEVVDEGVTGHIVESVDEAICKIGRVLALDRGRIRRRFEERFTAERMAKDYAALYLRMLSKLIKPHMPEPPKNGLIEHVH